MRNPYKAILAKHRRQQAEFIRGLRISMYKPEEMPLTDNEIQLFKSALTLIATIVICAIMLVAGCNQAMAEEYTDEQIVNAIRKAEGTWTYGTKSIKCETEKECRKICFNTVRNNRKRYQIALRNGYSKPFLRFLKDRYCPDNVSNDPTGLNKNWEKNVRYFLSKEK